MLKLCNYFSKTIYKQLINELNDLVKKKYKKTISKQLINTLFFLNKSDHISKDNIKKIFQANP